MTAAQYVGAVALADTQPPRSLTRAEALARRLRLDAEHARDAYRAIAVHANVMADHAASTHIRSETIRSDRATATAVLVALAAPLAASFAEATRMGLLDDIEAHGLGHALAALTLLEARVRTGLRDEELHARAEELRALAEQIDAFAGELES